MFSYLSDPDALIEELSMEAIERRESQGDPDLAALLDRAAMYITRALEEAPFLRDCE
jgi:hypothetical protein